MAQTYKSIVNIDYMSGNVSGTVYNGSKSLTELNKELYGEFAWSNPLHMDVFADVRKMEAEVVRICCNLFHGDANSCGTTTSGGTESILLACKAYRDMAMERGIRFPVILAPITAHAAFNKAAQYFRMRLQHVPIDPCTGMVDISKMRRAITRRTCMLVGSVPSFPHGIVDDIPAIAKLGREYNIPVHVDACLGGFLLPFMERAGFADVPISDFRVPGVTSISCDTHKYGFTPKGTSVILYVDHETRVSQFFVAPDWTGGIYASPTMPGSRPGALIAACWGTLMHFGQAGYVDATRQIIGTARKIRDGLASIEGVRVIGHPLMSVVAVISDEFSVFQLADKLSANGWNLNLLQYPNCFHLCCTLLHTKEGVADRFLDNVATASRELLANPGAKDDGVGVIYGMAQSVPDRKLVTEIAAGFLEACYSTNA